MKLLDLFSGIGGFSLAARWAAIETIQFVEKDKFCQKVLMKNFPNVPIHDDIKTFNFHTEVEILTGGFPCQPFSSSGKKRGIKDDRYLWPEMLRVIQQCHPYWVIAENVTGLVGMELENMLDDLAREGYECQSFVIPACAANAPHRRDRLWVIANAMRKRCDSGVYYWESGQLPKDKKWDMEKIHQDWQKHVPQSWQDMQANDWLLCNAHDSRRNDGVPTKLDRHRVKALGNAVVPQIAYVLLKSIVLHGT